MVDNRSNLMRIRHAEAKEKRRIFQELNPEEKQPYSEFLKNESVIDKQIVSYQVSYQVSYRGDIGSIYIAPKTFTVFGLKGQEDSIKSKTMNMILDSKGGKTDTNLYAGTQEAIKQGSSIEVKSFPRGLEESTAKPSIRNYSDIFQNNLVVENLDDSIKMKNQKNREGDLKLDIRHFM